MTNLLRPFSEWTEIVPPWTVTIHLTTARPRPTPSSPGRRDGGASKKAIEKTRRVLGRDAAWIFYGDDGASGSVHQAYRHGFAGRAMVDYVGQQVG